MKTKELKCADLRIGNWVKINLPHKSIIGKIDGLNRVKAFVEDKEGFTTLPIHDIQPIEHTEEVLVKIGFEDRKGYFNYSKVFGDENNYCDSIHIYYCPRLKHFKFTYDKVKECDLQTMDLYNIQYLHQLQNAYFLLINQELEVNL